MDDLFYKDTFIFLNLFLLVSPSRYLWNYFTTRVEYEERSSL